jgi:catechol 2,3-dioxygenase-like lactoylglutathione lyase family enzyme
MLADNKVKAFVITTDAKASKIFYTEILGFRFLDGDEYGLEFELKNALLRVSITTEEYAKPQQHTVLGWCVSDIYESVRNLKRKGVKFERYEFLQQDEHDVWNAKSGTKVAWFKDPHGNLLSIDQAGLE